MYKQRGPWIQPAPGAFHTWDELLVTGHMDKQTQPWRTPQRRLVLVMEHVVDPLCRHFGQPARITSAWRSTGVNRAINGARRSLHTFGMAVDLGFEGLTSFDIVAAMVELGIDYDKVIAYHPEVGGHVHASYKGPRSNRGRMLECLRGANGSKVYRVYRP